MQYSVALPKFSNLSFRVRIYSAWHYLAQLKATETIVVISRSRLPVNP